MQVWRICRARHAATAFSGEGARRVSGRWNPVNLPMVYTSLSLSLAALETFVHLDPSVAPDDLVSIGAPLPGATADCERLSVETLPKDWRRLNQASLQQTGADWVRSGRSLALMVPSAVVEGEWNVLLNPAHPQMAKVLVGEPRPFLFDARMFR